MNNEEYWISRIKKVYNANYQKKQIGRIYQNAYKQIENKIQNLYDELSAEGKLTTTKLYSYDRFQALLGSIKKECKGIRETLTPKVTNALTKAYKDTFENVEELLGSDSPWGIQNEKNLKSVLETEWAGSNYSRRIWKNTNLIAKRIESDVVTALTQGESGRILAKQIEKDFNVSFRAADRIVRTEIAHAINQSQLDTYRSHGVKNVKWSAAIESDRTCSLCKEYDGKIFEIDKCPVILHPNCRCTMLPIINTDFDKADKEWDNWLKEHNLRESEDGDLIDTLTGKPAKLHRKKNISGEAVDNSAESGIIKVDRVMTGHSGTPKKAEPNSIIDHKTNGKTDVRTFYDEKGLKAKDINTDSHGNLKRHPYGNNGEHAHDYEWDNKKRLKNRTTRELTEKERKENADIL